MSRNIKAVVGLSRGRVAFFDPLSNILLDIARPTAYVYEGTNAKDLIQHLGGAIYVVSGSLFDEVKEEAPKTKVEKPKVEKKEQEKQPVEEVVEAKEEVKTEEKPVQTEAKPIKAAKKKK